MAAKKTQVKPPSTIAFVLSLPSDVPAKEVVEKAKGQGINLSTDYVYKIRSRQGAVKAKRGPKAAPRVDTRAARPRAVATAPRAVSHAVSSDAEALLKALGAGIGLARAIHILEGERARVRAALGA